MSIHFHPLTIRDIRRETDDCVSISFAIPPELSEQFVYREGQNITLRVYIDGEEIRRSYSVCSSPLEDELRVAVKAVPGGLFSQYANTRLKRGDTIEVLPPTGKFYSPLEPERAKNYVAFAAGSGITPILSIIKTVLATEPASRFTLVYGNRNRHSIIFREQLEALKNRYMERFRLIHILSREKTDLPIQYGRIDATKCRELENHLIDWKQVDHFYICGPEAMIFSTRDYLLNAGVPAQRIHFELFTTPGQKSGPKTEEASGTGDLGPTARVQVKVDGRSFEMKVPYQGVPILDAALQAGADLPYACKGGVCCTCRARLVKGEVEMDQNYALEPEELEAGFILTCQSHPRTEEIVVDFDYR
jgi:ring-1,2-phenylacetyl-CoA epoxidase subunit PaaE